MAIENINIIDFVSIDNNGNVVLTISDHLEWNEKNEHILLLQNKINAYLYAIESGDLYENYPNSKNRKIIIDVVTKHVANEEGKRFLIHLNETLKDEGYFFRYSLVDNY